MGESGSGEVTRRGVLAAGGLAGASVVVAGCSVSYEPLPSEPSEPSEPPGPPGSAGGSGAAAPGAGDPAVLGPVSAVPVGGGVIYAAREVVVTQPSAGTFAAFSAICTHMRCLVSKVEDGIIYCPCHGSKFSIVDGSVKLGPATVPLPPRTISTADGDIRLD